MNARASSRTLRWAVSLTLACAAGAALAAEESSLVTLGLGAEYTDNVRRVTDGEEADTVVTASLNADIRRTTTRFDTGFNADLAYDYFTEGSYDAGVRGNAVLAFEGQIVRQRLSWYVDDSFGQLPLASLAPDTPDNRENFNVFTTGPRFTQPFGSRTRLILTGVYEIETYEQTPVDAKRTGADLALRRDISPSQYLEVTATTRDTRYDDDVYDDYDMDEYYLTWSATGAKTELTLSAGETRLSFPGRDDNSAMYRLDAERKVGSYGTLSLVGRSQKATTAEAFRTEQGAGAPTLATGPIAAVGEPFDYDYVGLGYDLGGRHLSGSLLASSGRYRYDTNSINNHDRKALNGSVDWIVSPTWTVGFGLEYAHETYELIDQDYKELGYLFDATLRLSRTLSLEFGAARFDRNGAAGSSAYDETRARIMVTYTSGKAG